MWAGAPFVWHIYRQCDGAHERKLDALLDRMAAPGELRTFWRAWNGLAEWPAALPAPDPWRAACQEWRGRLLQQSDLTTRLLHFVASKR
jgi:hypothetical protein